ncbi:MAG TPA: four helix bundle protein [Ferruginibacter sp.]|nr:four helix bundle protein [Ferruginibacter sp.]HQW60888.1 four helix bundle protein [Ferruginibacter sp.]HQY17302.1 four helix bundle protein [Ferruginibacter sp.]HQY41942.1 four helix bundle protein [Ferruginibacter sp.]HRB23168.1 four helix bundle protein [Ferruginibacter sp.]
MQCVICIKSYSFAMEAIKGYKFLVNEKKAFVLSKGLLRAGTPFGANISEAVSGQSKRDFVNNLSITIKNARKTLY